MRWSEDGYVTRLRATRGDVVRAEPFEAIASPGFAGARSNTTCCGEAIELAVGTLFGDDPPG
jgi:hypothetical protein